MSNTLFTPFTVRGLTIPNRIVMAPMTRGFSPDGVPGQNVVEYYKRRAESDVPSQMLSPTRPVKSPRSCGMSAWSEKRVQAIIQTPNPIVPLA